MSTAIATLMMVALMLATVSFLAQGSFTAMAQLSDAWTTEEERRLVDARTSVTSGGVTYATPNVDVTVTNNGDEAIRGFSMWDVLVQYYETDGTYHSTWVPYVAGTSPGDGQWSVTGIYLDAGTLKAEATQPGILDPSEELILRVSVTPAADSTANNRVIIGTANGVTLSTPF